MIKNLSEKIEVVQNELTDEKYFCMKHKSGLDIYVLPKNHTTAYAVFAAKYGSIDSIFRVNGEKEFTKVPDGIAHFLEHKLFENEDGVDTFKRYAETGASANAYTDFDKTAYLFSCTGNFEQSLEILLDFVTHPYFTPATVEKEQGIIGQEIRMYDDNPGWQVYFGMLANMYQKHSVRLDIAGTVETIAEITDEYLYKCYNTFYNLNNMALCVAGNVTMEQVAAVADKVLKQSAPIEIERFEYDEPSSPAVNRVEKKLKVAKPQFNIGLKDSETGYYGAELAKRNYEADIINEMLFSRSGEFYSRLYEANKINGKFGCGSEYHQQYGYLMYSGESDNPDEVFEEIIAEFEKQTVNRLDREEFDRSKRVVYASAVKLFNSTENIANSFIYSLFRGYDILDLPGYIAEITFEDVENRLKRLFKRENFILSIVSPID